MATNRPARLVVPAKVTNPAAAARSIPRAVAYPGRWKIGMNIVAVNPTVARKSGRNPDSASAETSRAAPPPAPRAGRPGGRCPLQAPGRPWWPPRSRPAAPSGIADGARRSPATADAALLTGHRPVVPRGSTPRPNHPAQCEVGPGRNGAMVPVAGQPVETEGQHRLGATSSRIAASSSTGPEDGSACSEPSRWQAPLRWPRNRCSMPGCRICRDAAISRSRCRAKAAARARVVLGHPDEPRAARAQTGTGG